MSVKAGAVWVSTVCMLRTGGPTVCHHCSVLLTRFCDAAATQGNEASTWGRRGAAARLPSPCVEGGLREPAGSWGVRGRRNPPGPAAAAGVRLPRAGTSRGCCGHEGRCVQCGAAASRCHCPPALPGAAAARPLPPPRVPPTRDGPKQPRGRVGVREEEGGGAPPGHGRMGRGAQAGRGGTAPRGCDARGVGGWGWARGCGCRGAACRMRTGLSLSALEAKLRCVSVCASGASARVRVCVYVRVRAPGAVPHVGLTRQPRPDPGL